MIELIDLNKKYDDNIIFDNVSLKIDSKINFIIGENGTGKSTILNVIAGHDTDYSGIVNLNNINNIEYITQFNKLVEEFTMKENIELFAKGYSSERLNTLLDEFSMLEIYNSKTTIDRLSGGEAKKVHLIIGLLRDCELLILDEVDNHLDIKSISILVKLISEVDKQVIICSHSLDDFMDDVDYAIFEVGNNKITKIRDCDTFELNSACEHKEYELDKKDISKLLGLYNGIRTTLFLVCIVTVISLSFIIFNNLFSITQNIKNTNTTLEFSEDSSLIYPPAFTSNFFNLGDEDSLRTTPLYFTDEDLNRLNEIDYVKEVIPVTKKIGGVISNAFDVNGDLYSHSTKPVGVENKMYNFNVLPLSYDVLKDIPLVYYTQIKTIIAGDLPKNDSNEILIDDYYANYLVDKFDITQKEDLIGNSYPIDVTNNLGDEITADLRISGIYESSVDKSGVIYTSLNTTSDYYERRVEYWDDETFEMIETQIDDVVEYILNGDYSLYENYYDSSQTYYEGFYITIDDSSKLSDLNYLIWDYDKYIEVLNNESIKDYPIFVYLKKDITHSIFLILTLITTTILVNIFGYKLYLNNVSRELELLKYYNFSSKSINNYIHIINNKFSNIFTASLLLSFVILLYKTRYYIQQALLVYIIIILVYLLIMLLVVINKLKTKRKKNEE